MMIITMNDNTGYQDQFTALICQSLREFLWRWTVSILSPCPVVLETMSCSACSDLMVICLSRSLLLRTLYFYSHCPWMRPYEKFIPGTLVDLRTLRTLSLLALPPRPPLLQLGTYSTYTYHVDGYYSQDWLDRGQKRVVVAQKVGTINYHWLIV